MLWQRIHQHAVIFVRYGAEGLAAYKAAAYGKRGGDFYEYIRVKRRLDRKSVV